MAPPNKLARRSYSDIMASGSGYDLNDQYPIAPLKDVIVDEDLAARNNRGIGPMPPREHSASFNPIAGPNIGPRVYGLADMPEKPPIENLDKAAVADTMSKIDVSVPEVGQVKDRYEQMFFDAQNALQRGNAAGNAGAFYNPSAKNTRSLNPTLSGGSQADDWYNSPERGALMRQESRAFKLLTGGSFADQQNVNKEQRQMQAASAAAYMGEAALKGQEATNEALQRQMYLAGGETDIEKKRKQDREQLTALVADMLEKQRGGAK